MSRTTLLELDNVTKQFGDITAVKDVSLTINRGETVGILGKNGAGKSTLFSLISGINSPTKGTVLLDGLNPRNPVTRRALGVTPQGSGLDPKVKVKHFLNFVSYHYGTASLVDEIVYRFQLSKLLNRIIGNLSGGQQRLVAVACAFLADAPLTILDEPTTGLDPIMRSAIWKSIQYGSTDDKTILITSHYIEEIEEICKRVVVMDSGMVIADSDTEAISKASSASVFELRGFSASLTNLGISENSLLTNPKDGLIRFKSDKPKEVIANLYEIGLPFRQIRISPPTLEEAFIILTGEERR